jgi:hypothetical protein
MEFEAKETGLAIAEWRSASILGTVGLMLRIDPGTN